MEVEFYHLRQRINARPWGLSCVLHPWGPGHRTQDRTDMKNSMLWRMIFLKVKMGQSSCDTATKTNKHFLVA
eukprot:1134720-Ditylum_brightwellii.AAC.1